MLVLVTFLYEVRFVIAYSISYVKNDISSLKIKFFSATKFKLLYFHAQIKKKWAYPWNGEAKYFTIWNEIRMYQIFIVNF